MSNWIICSYLDFLGSGRSDDSNYESLQLYEEIDGYREISNSESKNKCTLNCSEKYENIRPSILRPPDISDIFLRLWNENNIISQSLYFSSHSPNIDGSMHQIIPRPKVGWPLRKVTFGKWANSLSLEIINNLIFNLVNIEVSTEGYVYYYV